MKLTPEQKAHVAAQTVARRAETAAATAALVGLSSGDTERFAKLPEWVQMLVSRLARDARYWRERAIAGPEGSDTFVTNYIAEATPLGAGPTIEFVVRPGRFAEVIRVRLDTDRHTGVRSLDVNSTGCPVHVLPKASNAFTVVLG